MFLFQMSDFFDDQYQYDSSDDTRSDNDWSSYWPIDHPNEESDLSEEEESDEAVVDDPGIVSDEAAVDDSRIVVTPPLPVLQWSGVLSFLETPRWTAYSPGQLSNSQHGRNLW